MRRTNVAEASPRLTTPLMCLRLLPWLLIAASYSLDAQSYRVYIGELGPDHVTIAWGMTTGDNTIGRSSPPHGPAQVRVGSIQTAVSDANWVVVRGLQPDTKYDYEVTL